ncbi:MAG: hypothetical protein RLZZ156_974 [Deinococcota bacterium]|jgi:phosphopantothenoylcysteine decarboxylase / phosphopantothenate---cysteine ligase
MSNKMCKRLLVGIAGSSAATQIHDYLFQFRQFFADEVKVIMSHAASEMAQLRTIELFCDDRVFIEFWDRSSSVKTPHIQLTQWAEVFLVIPATANILGKAANGIADDLLSTAVLSYLDPIVFAPAMNPSMWNSKALKRNVKQLQQDGHCIVEPQEGISATTGRWDSGLAMPPAEEIIRHLEHTHLTKLRLEYWEEATRDKALTPMQRRMNVNQTDLLQLNLQEV